MNIAKHLNKMERAKNNIYKFKNAFIECENDAKIAVKDGCQFLFHCSWLKKDPFPSVLVLRKHGQLQVSGNFKIFSGAKIFINQDAMLTLGSGYINNYFTLHCFGKITIGEDVAIADNVTIRDSDNHVIASSPNYQMTKPVTVGNHVWIGMNATILKGVNIGDGSIVAAGSIVTRDIPARCLAAGVPARVIKENVTWE